MPSFGEYVRRPLNGAWPGWAVDPAVSRLPEDRPWRLGANAMGEQSGDGRQAAAADDGGRRGALTLVNPTLALYLTG